MSQNLEILLVEDEALIARSLGQALEARGHHVLICSNAEEAALQPEVDVLVTDINLGTKSGLDLLADFRGRGSKTRAVVVTGLPSFEACQRALRLGASEVLAKPFRIEELVSAVEGNVPTSLAPPALTAFSTTSDEDAPQRIGRKVNAFALEYGAPLAARARIATACAEIADNCLQHAYDDCEGSNTTQAWYEGSTLLVRISDTGPGFDVLSDGHSEPVSVFDGGLARVSCLVEGLEIQSAPGQGTQVILRTHVASTRFDNDDPDLSDVDFFLPGEACKLLRKLGGPEGMEPNQLPAHLAICVGRMLSGPDPKAILRTPTKS